MGSLYHGSAFRTDRLMPGYRHHETEVQWDDNESNRYLYATTSRDDAISLGFASAIEQQYRLEGYHTQGRSIRIVIDGPRPSMKDVETLQVYLYTILYSQADGWVKNNNPNNGMTTEYKTSQTIDSARIDVTAINLKEWLSDHQIRIERFKSSPVYEHWR